MSTYNIARALKTAVAAVLCVLTAGCAAPAAQTQPEPTPFAEPTLVEPYTLLDLDYSEHTSYSNEETYVTKLADPSPLKQGKHSYALSEPLDDWSMFEYSPEKNVYYGYDARGRDASALDFSVVENYSDISFNSKTVWPAQMPDDFHPDEILDFNKNPGLGIRALHAEGIDGRGVSIAIIDQPLLVEHEEYYDRLMLYERIHCSGYSAQMHAPAVASIAVGKTVGVAPAAKLYLISCTPGHFSDKGGFEYDYSILADCVRRVVEINERLPEGEKIRVISTSFGYSEDMDIASVDELKEAVKLANDNNIAYMMASGEAFYPGYKVAGVTRDYYADPDDPYSYRFDDAQFEFLKNTRACVLVPGGSRAYASCLGVNDYEIEHSVGESWTVPWCAGLYALCCQVKPEITPEEFMSALHDTGRVLKLERNGEAYSLGKLVDPAAVIESFKK